MKVGKTVNRSLLLTREQHSRRTELFFLWEVKTQRQNYNVILVGSNVYDTFYLYSIIVVGDRACCLHLEHFLTCAELLER